MGESIDLTCLAEPNDGRKPGTHIKKHIMDASPFPSRQQYGIPSPKNNRFDFEVAPPKNVEKPGPVKEMHDSKGSFPPPLNLGGRSSPTTPLSPLSAFFPTARNE